MARVLLVLLRAFVGLCAAAATWMAFHIGGGVFVDDPAYEHPDDSFVLAILAASLLPIVAAALARPLVRRVHPPPANVDDVPGIAGRIAREDGAEGEGWPPALAGIAIGAVVASFTASDAVTPIAVGAAVVAGAVFVVVARFEMRDRRRTEEMRDRIHGVRGRGTRVVADVIETGFGGTWRYSGPVIRVTARFTTPKGVRIVTDDVVTEPADAPTPGGTVLVWYLDEGMRRQDVYLEQDPDSIREPGAAERYKAPDATS